jgi:hypothetical protein
MNNDTIIIQYITQTILILTNAHIYLISVSILLTKYTGVVYTLYIDLLIMYSGRQVDILEFSLLGLNRIWAGWVAMRLVEPRKRTPFIYSIYLIYTHIPYKSIFILIVITHPNNN